MNSPLDKYRILATIGAGAYGTVYKAENVESHALYALKQIKQQTEWKRALNLNELRSFQALKEKSQFIVQLCEVFSAGGSVYLVFELIVGGSLFDVMQRRTFAADDVAAILLDILRGLAAMHRAGFMHRDLKPENILFQASEGVYKIGDLGCARAVKTTGNLTAYVGTRWYRAPELLLHAGRYDDKADVFSAGLIACEVLLGRPLVSGSSELSQALGLFYLLGVSGAELAWFSARSGCYISCAVSAEENSYARVESALLYNIRSCTLPLASVLSRMLYPVPERRATACESIAAVQARVLLRPDVKYPPVGEMTAQIDKTAAYANKTTAQAGEMASSQQNLSSSQILVESKKYKSEYIRNTKHVEKSFDDNNDLDSW